MIAESRAPEVLVLMPEFLAYHGLWVAGWRLWAGEGPPISDGLRADLDGWIDVYSSEYFENGDEWTSAAVAREWHRNGWTLFVRCNRELMPQGFVVLPVFEIGPWRCWTISDETSRRFSDDALVRATAADLKEVDDLIRLVEEGGPPSPPA